MGSVGLEVRHVEGLREHYALTLRLWVGKLEASWDQAVPEVGPSRARIRRLYVAASALGFEAGGIHLHQVLAMRVARRTERDAAATRLVRRPTRGETMVREVWGRGAELRQASRMLESVPSGPAALILDGEEGIGKTTIWDSVVSQADTLGYGVVSARPVASESRLAFAGVADLLRDGLDEALTDLPPPQQTALEGVMLQVDVEGSPDPKAVAFGLHGCLQAVA